MIIRCQFRTLYTFFFVPGFTAERRQQAKEDKKHQQNFFFFRNILSIQYIQLRSHH